MSPLPNKIDPLLRQLDRRVDNTQVNLLAQGRVLISDWLQASDKEGCFELAVDWLLGNGADRYFNSNRDVLAVVVIRDAMQLFEVRDVCTEDIYQDARNWFGVN